MRLLYAHRSLADCWVRLKKYIKPSVPVVQRWKLARSCAAGVNMNGLERCGFSRTF